MNDKTIIDGVDISECEFYWREKELCNNGNLTGYCQENKDCLYKKYKRKEQEHFELANVYHSLVRIANNRLDKITDLQQQLDQLKAKNEELIIRITKIFACLIKANRIDKIVDTIWVDDITTLWDYIALTLGIEGDQTQVEEQILQKISEVENDNRN